MTQDQCLEALKKEGKPMTALDVAAALNDNRKNVQYYLRRLYEKGEITRDTTLYKTKRGYRYKIIGRK